MSKDAKNTPEENAAMREKTMAEVVMSKGMPENHRAVREVRLIGSHLDAQIDDLRHTLDTGSTRNNLYAIVQRIERSTTALRKELFPNGVPAWKGFKKPNRRTEDKKPNPYKPQPAVDTNPSRWSEETKRQVEETLAANRKAEARLDNKEEEWPTFDQLRHEHFQEDPPGKGKIAGPDVVPRGSHYEMRLDKLIMAIHDILCAGTLEERQKEVFEWSKEVAEIIKCFLRPAGASNTNLSVVRGTDDIVIIQTTDDAQTKTLFFDKAGNQC